MAEQRNFLLGYGERLTSAVKLERGGETTAPPYQFTQARDRLTPQFSSAAVEFATLPSEACPDNYAVGLLTIHPEYIAKSYFPATLLREARMEAIGSRPVRVKPEKWKKKKEPEESFTTQIYVSARRDDFAEFAQTLPTWSQAHPGANQLFEVEAFRAVRQTDRLQPVKAKVKEPVLEVVLHTTGLPNPGRILDAFEAYAESFNLKPDLDRRFQVGGLCFLPIQSPQELLSKLSQFAFLRTVRVMPTLRPLGPIIRSTPKNKPFAASLPTTGPLDKQLHGAIFDGGMGDAKALKQFVQVHELPGIGKEVDEYLDHGTGVTSAALFGPISKGTAVPQPYGRVDHYRVLDDRSANDPYDLYDTLKRIRSVLQSRKYSFVNLSIGPALPIEDRDVHAWTAVLDDLFSDGDTLATVAVGNSGEADWKSGNARVQVPSDSVNSLAVGAANSQGKSWTRAAYSSIGPGRSPGLIKPDLVAFGGSNPEPFYVLDRSISTFIPEAGTSYAAPNTFRMGMGLRAHFGNLLSPLAIRGLLVHSAEADENPSREVGWGRLPQHMDSLVVCGDGVARVVYQEELAPAQYLRAPIPLPSGNLEGMITISATFCIACETDPQDPSNYTRGGLEIFFRPHAEKLEEGKKEAKTTTFFRRSDYDTEKDLRHDAHKWETTLHRSRRFRATSLKDPVFDVHYQTRLTGRTAQGGDKIRYALIITVSAPGIPNLYDRIVQRYRTQLEPLSPVIDVPVQILR